MSTQITTIEDQLADYIGQKVRVGTSAGREFVGNITAPAAA
jgi:small nuclear ribonucleoprotein (snRNP)-like protein